MFTTENTNLLEGTLVYTLRGGKASCQIVEAGQAINLDPCHANKYAQKDVRDIFYTEVIHADCACEGSNAGPTVGTGTTAQPISITVGGQTVTPDSSGDVDVTNLLDDCLNAGLVAKLAEKGA